MPFKDPEKKKEYHRKYNKEYYKKNKDWFIKRVLRNKIKLRRKKREWIVKELGGKCQNPDCGYNKDIVALDIHHIDGRLKTDKYINYLSWKKLKKYIKENKSRLKILCANCHRIKHFSRE